MTSTGFFWCSFCFITVTFGVVYAYRRFHLSRFPALLVFILMPGWIAANVASFLISEPIIPAVTDMPINYGFPVSYFTATAWSGNEFSLYLFLLNLALFLFAGYVIGSRVISRRTYSERPFSA